MWIAGTPEWDQIRSWAMWLKPHYLGSTKYYMFFFSFGMLGLEFLASVAREGNWRGRVNSSTINNLTHVFVTTCLEGDPSTTDICRRYLLPYCRGYCNAVIKNEMSYSSRRVLLVSMQSLHFVHR